MGYVLQTNGLTKVYGNKPAVNKVNMQIEKGDIYGFIGQNGAGKTTLIRMVTGLAAPTNGSIELFDSKDLVSQRCKIGTVIENPSIYFHMTAAENLEVQRRLLGIKDKSIIEDTLRAVGLIDAGRKKARNFSLGMKQRLAIAIALMGDPEFLILDEPTNGLDPSGIKEIRELIQRLNQERGITVLISSHILGELSKLATRYGIIHHGALIEEFTEDELWERCKANLVVQVMPQDVERAVDILENTLHTKQYQVQQGGVIILYDFIEQPGAVNQALAAAGVMVQALTVSHGDLEEYFLKAIGGMR